MVYASGLPFGPPENEEFRNHFTGRDYKRVDVGFSKLISFGEHSKFIKLKEIWLNLEVLNLLGSRNIISYSWIKTFDNTQYAVPNSLSQRLLNIKAMVKL